MTKAFLLVIAAGAAVSFPAAAAAQASPNRIVSERVSYADLDLGSAQGVATLDGRLGAAIRRLCGSGRIRSSVEQVQRRSCRREAQSSVRPQRTLAIAGAQRGSGAIQVAAAHR